MEGKGAQRVIPAGSLVGMRVRNRSGEDLGKIEQIMIDMKSGCVAYAVLSFGGFMGLGDKLFAIPMQALHMREDDTFLLEVSREKLNDASGFDKSNWPDMADPEWGAALHDSYSVKPYWKARDDS